MAEQKYTISDIIETYISGDWGNDEPTEDASCPVSCIRGADIVPIYNSEYRNIPLRYISEKSLSNRALREGDIVIEKSGGSPTQSTGRVVYISKELLEEKQDIVCSNFCAAFRIKPEWDAKYVYYYLQHIYNAGVFFNFEGKTSGLKNLIMDTAFKSITIKKIAIETQRSIATVLSTIVSKMAANRAINHYLEAMAKQLYDYWFVQFDFPDENGMPYKSSGGKMVWNEKLKREIPEEWTNCTLDYFLTIKNGKDHKHLGLGEYPVYGSGGEMRRVNDFLYNGESVLMPRKGSLNNILYVNEPFWSVDTMFYSEMKYCGCAKYVFYSIKDIDFTRLDSGTGVPSMTSSTLYAIPLIKPEDEIIQKFDNTISPLFHEMATLFTEIKKLSLLRDELISLLMNGQVSVRQLNNDLPVFKPNLYMFFIHKILYLYGLKITTYERTRIRLHSH